MSWPTGVGTDAELYNLKNNLSTTLNGSIDDSTTTVVLTDATGFPTAGYVTIGTEAISYTGISVNTLTGVTRGADNTTAAAHTDGDPVWHLYVADHHNKIVDEIQAVETSLDLTASRAVETNGSGRVSASAVTATELNYLDGVTSPIQTQIDGKVSKSGDTISGDLTVTGTATSGDLTVTGTATIGELVTDNPLGFKNRIINGDMAIDQRNAGAAVTFGSGLLLPVDRWKTYSQTGSGHTAQRSSTAPDGFRNSIVVTIGTGASPSAAHQNLVFYAVEGYDIADAGFGTSWAKQITISFWVRSSVTGIYSLAFENSANNRSYIANYTINSANTFEKKTITITADTTGTWEVTNLTGLYLRFDLGSGSDWEGTGGAWAAINDDRTSDSVKLVETSGATWYITGVQLELGSVATAFEKRSFEDELALCMRYFTKSYDYSVVPGSSTTVGNESGVRASGFWACGTRFKVKMRSTPTIVSYNPVTGASGRIREGTAGTSEVATPVDIGEGGFTNSGTGGTTGIYYSWHYTADAEL